MDEDDQRAEIRRVARETDPDRYTSALFAPREARDDLFALYAFNAELALIGNRVSEPGLGEIRLQWWRDALAAAAAGEPTGHPIADAMARAAKRCGLSRELLDGMIDARSFDVSTKIMPDDTALATYLDQTAGAVFLLAASIVAARVAPSGPSSNPSDALRVAAMPAGRAYGLTGLMRALAAHAWQGRVDLPADALAAQGTSPARLLIGEPSEGLDKVLVEQRRRADKGLREAVVRVKALPKPTQIAFLPLALVEPYLSRLAASDPWAGPVELNPLYRLWRLATYRFPASA